MIDTLFTQSVLDQAKRFLEYCKKEKLQIVTAESCTAGLIAAALTHHAGSSECVQGGFITYSNIMKHHSLQVPENTLEAFGAVSEQVALAMVKGALNQSPIANFAISVTGIAGPDGGTPQKPIGLVWIGIQHKNFKPIARRYRFWGSRSQIRLQTVKSALTLSERYLMELK